MLEQIPPALAATVAPALIGAAVLLYRPLPWWLVFLGLKEDTE